MLRTAGVNLADIADLLGDKDVATKQTTRRSSSITSDKSFRNFSAGFAMNPSEIDEMSLKNVTQAQIGTADARKLMK